ncbi:hypothetical protein NDU88_008372, partial [Pleurodeles waltl]
CPVGFALHTLQCLQIFSCIGFQVPCGICYSHSPVPADVLKQWFSGALWGLTFTLSSACRCSHAQAFRCPVRFVMPTLQCSEDFLMHRLSGAL